MNPQDFIAMLQDPTVRKEIGDIVVAYLTTLTPDEKLLLAQNLLPEFPWELAQTMDLNTIDFEALAKHPFIPRKKVVATAPPQGTQKPSIWEEIKAKAKK